AINNFVTFMDIIDAEPLQLFLIMFSKLSQPMPEKGPCSEYYLESVYR
ncbi:MAG: hypothetical protein CFH07_01959, partial [Alphaproteobacteria bacterium MarineAlpha3_Bin6]